MPLDLSANYLPELVPAAALRYEFLDLSSINYAEPSPLTTLFPSASLFSPTLTKVHSFHLFLALAFSLCFSIFDFLLPFSTDLP